jgi:hypothetical protein
MSSNISPEAALERAKWKQVFHENATKEPYRIDFHRQEGWSRYKGLKHVPTKGWWKDYGMHGLARKMVALGLPDGPVETFDNTGMKCLMFKSLYWMAEHSITETDKGGIQYNKYSTYWEDKED